MFPLRFIVSEQYDDESGYPFYENMETGEILWEKPDNFDTALLPSALAEAKPPTEISDGEDNEIREEHAAGKQAP